MPSSPPSADANGDRPPLDAVASARWTTRPQPPAGDPWLHQEVARRMAQRLSWIRAQPSAWVHWMPVGVDESSLALVQGVYPKAAYQGVERTPERVRLAQTRMRAPWWRRWRAPARAWGLPRAVQAQMLWSNMGLHHEADPVACLRQWQQALAVDGFVMFSCLGPDTLRELRAVYASLGWPAPAHAYTDMHDWGDMLVHNGFAEPVLDMERITLTYASADDVLRDLRALGRNLSPVRFAGLRGRGWRERLCAALTTQLSQPAQGGRLALTFEVIYGHALRPEPRARVTAQTAVSLQDMRSMLGTRID